MDTVQQFEATVRSSPLLGPVLDRWHDVGLPDSWLVAGALAQTMWNFASGYPPEHGIKDIDIIYFDAENLTAGKESKEEQRIRALFESLPVQFDVKNEARVHLWYEAQFGSAIEPYRSSRDAIATMPTNATAIGVRLLDGRFEVAEPFGLTDLYRLVVRPNKAQITAQRYEAKVSRWRPLWPALDIRPW